MRILFITPYVPSLIRVRPYNFIRQLSQRHEVTLVSLVQDDIDANSVDAVREYCDAVYPIQLSKSKSVINCCRRLLTRMPLQAAYTEWPGVHDEVRHIAESREFDVVHVEHIRGAHMAGSISGVPRIFDSVDCITHLLKQRLATVRNPLSRLVAYRELATMQYYEPMITSAFDRVVITSRRDKRTLEWLMRTRLGLAATNQSSTASTGYQHRITDDTLRSGVEIVPNGVDSYYFRPTQVTPDPSTIVFCGKMSYFANASAALYFYHEVLPNIREKRPGARLRIVGSKPPRAVRRLMDDTSVEVTGHVEDVRPHLAYAGVVVCPLQVAVGMQNKALEAMSMAKAVVATPMASAGIPEARDGIHMLTARSPREFSDAVVALLSDPARARELGKNACQLVQARYSWDASARSLEGVYRQAIDKHRIYMTAAA